MPIDFRNTNSVWASVAAETLARLGLTTAIVCPGSRSTPLTFAFAQHPDIEALPILDERSASFFALGCAKRQHRPVALVCTSGTAGANFYPAVIEAYESGVPLLIFTADRPPEMRDCASGQTIDQQKLFGRFTRHYSELAVPVATLPMLAYLRQTLVNGWRQSSGLSPGPVHFNCPFRDPLPPIAAQETQAQLSELSTTLNKNLFFASVRAPAPAITQVQTPPISTWQQNSKGLIIAGPTTPAAPSQYCQAVSELSQQLGWPVLAEGLSPLRNYHSLNTALIFTYDVILRNPQRADTLVPEVVIQIGPLPISKVLRQWLQAHQPQRWVVGSQRNLDPLHGPTQFLSTDLESLVGQLDPVQTSAQPSINRPIQNSYVQQWLAHEGTIRQGMDDALAAEADLVESKIAWLLSQHLPERTPLFIANSMPVRDVEYFWKPNNRHIQPVFSRGANGIDGTLSTAMGLAHHNRPTVLLTGDLAFLHDTNGLLNVPQLAGHLTVVLINNNGGGIFEMLPISQFEPEFEQYFVTPQQVNVAALCHAYGVEHRLMTTEKDLVDGVKTLPDTGMRVLEVVCDRKQSARQRKRILGSL